MAHAGIHFAAGAVAGMALCAPRLVRAWRERGPLGPAVTRWVAVSWAAGFLAIVPSLLRYAGMPAGWCEGWWMNVFVLHPALNAVLRGGQALGPAALGAVLAFQYAVVLLVHIGQAARARRGSLQGTGSSASF